ncbi:hypothetical protein DH2020_022495 [Rehmannia glutinosa]|uniref:F-box domain-containing protein n=1 Tax=Rehmannia glutinosa TaxID=99300 RepID=A0ABR0WHQ7_REHGL
MKPKTKISKTASESSPEKSSAKTVASIDDLLTEIFVRLPINSLFHFKLVSKHWNSLISNLEIYHLRNRKPNPAVGLIFQYRTSLTLHPRAVTNWYPDILFFNKSFRKLKFTQHLCPRPREITILNSCNGLLVCRDPCRTYLIYNPTTNKYSTLPELDGGRSIRNGLRGMILAFDPSKSPHYKVVCVFASGDVMGIYKFEVYSSETSSWRKYGEPFKAKVKFQNGVYWNGAIHWIGIKKTGKSFYFNPNDDDWMPKVMPTPPMQDRVSIDKYYFGESYDHLHFIDGFGMWNEIINVYEMRRDYSEWFVKYTLDLSSKSYTIGYLFPICTLIRGKKDEDSFLILRTTKGIIRYNLACGTSEIIDKFDVAKHRARFCAEFSFQYIECINSV